MKNIPKHRVHVLLSLFLSAVFFSTFLIKPVHILFVHHHHEIILNNTEETSVSISSETECPICEFEFCFFLSTNHPDIQKVPSTYSELKIPQLVFVLVNQALNQFQQRGPPKA